MFRQPFHFSTEMREIGREGREREREREREGRRSFTSNSLLCKCTISHMLPPVPLMTSDPESGEEI